MTPPPLGRLACELMERLRDSGAEAGMLADLQTLVGLETPSGDREALSTAADWLEGWLAPLGEVERIGAPGSAPHLLLTVGDRALAGPLILTHYDTVWPLGTAAAWRFAVTDGIATGPGVFDMKAGIVLARRALQVLQDHGAGGPVVRLLVTADEEIGSPTSRGLITELARACTAALCLEPPAGVALKTARKGRATVHVVVHGRSAHAGLAPEDGINAVEELMAMLARMREAVTGLDATVSVGQIAGGTGTNVVPELAEAHLDVRAWSREALDAALAVIAEQRPEHAEARAEITVRSGRPPMERTPATAVLLDRYREAAEALGLRVEETATGGGSDGSLAAAAGAATLDGLGIRGGGAHARDEHVEVAHLVPQAAALGALLAGCADPISG